ncbi:MAG TPA: FprA family A-type flavoprotein [Candidatus Avacidaminococcus intestinavium]|uniref:FprA family A-type flavoprotein n=1 Tax=Candidatus Avacidaminococcus intestinavium TaxID=2840684 RepID=A0A9D1MNZ9_9FIRM|nr:FprA family A-type flavoprotein [Candidatus Avacidaminococcus intestinavium]
MKPFTIAENIYDVGIIDWTTRDFHGYVTPRGVTYNSYLIVDEKNCLIDTVKKPFTEEFLRNISKVINLAELDYVVINHVEPDHSGAMPELAALAPNAVFVITQQGKNEAIQHYGDIFNFMVVKEGDTLTLGKNELYFQPLPMLHWPDSMATYLKNEQILFSNDAFGQHYCTSKRFDHDLDKDILFYEAQKYFANILWPYAKLVPRALSKLQALPLKMIAPAHGAIWSDYIEEILMKYSEWGQASKSETLLIAYETMWGGTEKLARSISHGAATAGVSVRLFRLNTADNSQIVAELLTAGGVLFGSSTLNSGMMPNMGSLLVYLKGLQPKGKLAAAFGTYGWNGGAQKGMEEYMHASGFDVQSGFNCKWTPTFELDAAEQFGYEFALKIKEQNR